MSYRPDDSSKEDDTRASMRRSAPRRTTIVTSFTARPVGGVCETTYVSTRYERESGPVTVWRGLHCGVNGGEYADGGETLKLLLGKKITLQNTADGSRFELELLSIQGFPLPKQKG